MGTVRQRWQLTNRAAATAACQCLSFSLPLPPFLRFVRSAPQDHRLHPTLPRPPALHLCHTCPRAACFARICSSGMAVRMSTARLTSLAGILRHSTKAFSVFSYKFRRSEVEQIWPLAGILQHSSSEPEFWGWRPVRASSPLACGSRNIRSRPLTMLGLQYRPLQCACCVESTLFSHPPYAKRVPV